MLGIDIIKYAGGGSGGGSGSLVDTNVGGTTYAQWTISNDGFTYTRRNSGVSRKGNAWINPQTGFSDYDVRATLSDGDSPDGTFGTWMNMASAYTWGWTNQTSAKNCDILIELRRVSDSVTIDSATISLQIFGLE